MALEKKKKNTFIDVLSNADQSWSWVYSWDVYVSVCVNFRHSTIRKWHYGNAGITMKRAARGMLRATFYIQHLISQPTAFTPMFPVYKSSLKPATTSPYLFSSLFMSQRQTIQTQIFPLPCTNSPVVSYPVYLPYSNPCVPAMIPHTPAHLFQLHHHPISIYTGSLPFIPRQIVCVQRHFLCLPKFCPL